MSILRIVLAINLLCICETSYAQDLIERTLNDITLPQEKIEKPVALSIYSYSWPKSSASIFSLDTQYKALKYSEYTDRAIYLNIDRSGLDKIEKSNNELLRFTIPVDQTKGFDLILERVEILAPDYKLETSDGRVIYPDRSKFKFYRGIVEDDPNSIATVSLVDGKFQALISDNYGNYVLGELPKEKGKFVLYNDRNLKKSIGDFCQSGQLSGSLAGLNVQESYEKSTISPCIPIYVEADFAMYQAHGNNINNVQSFIASLVNEVATLYFNNTGSGGSSASIDISLSETMVLTSAAQDPYDQINSIVTILNEFGRIRQDSPDGRLKHLISTRNIGGGIAWLDVLCSNYFVFGGNNHAGPFAVSAGMGTSITAFPTYSWNVEVFAHEMGHNMGSPHTQACAWGAGNNSTIDDCANYVAVNNNFNDDPWEDNLIDEADEAEGFGCWNPNNPIFPSGGGTIMSYCHLLQSVGINFNKGFGPEPGQLIYNRYNNASCTLECESDEILGCTDEDAYNYDEDATEDDGSCQTCSDGLKNGDEEAVDCGGSYPGCPACTIGCGVDPDAHNYVNNPDIEEDCETCTDGMQNGDETNIDCGGSNPNCPACVTGCTDVAACNYDPAANVNMGCEYTSCAGCTEVFASNYDPSKTINDGSCEYDCTSTTENEINGTNVNSIIITKANILESLIPGPIEVTTGSPIYYRAKNSVEMNQGFSVSAGSSLTIDTGDCEED